VHTQAKQNEEFIHSLLSIGRQVFSHLQENMHNLLWKTNATTLHNSLFLVPPAFVAEHDIVWYGISLWSVGISCPGCVLSQLLVHPQTTHWWSGA